MEILVAAVCSFILDLLFGDPEWLLHPVIIMGKCISFLEKFLRKIFPKTKGGERAAGFVLAAVLPIGTLAVTGGIIYLLGLIHPALRFAAEVFWGYQALAMKCLAKECNNIYKALKDSTIEQARKAVGRVVGRDTGELTAEGVTKATVETIAENFSDGVIAPLFYLMIGGAPLALCYKSINTMDSTVGYKNDRYMYFGTCAAVLDDIVNWIPARISAFLIMIGAAFAGGNTSESFRIWKRDKRKHASPNSAQTESAMAGALCVQLAGPAKYFGVLHEKQYIGDPARPVETEDILRANRIMYASGALGLILFAALRYLTTLII